MTSPPRSLEALRLLVVADEEPLVDAPTLVAGNRPDAVVTLGDLPLDWLLGLGELELPRLGVHGNHDGEGDLEQAGITDAHLQRIELGAWTLSGFEGCVRYSDGPHQYTQDEAAMLVQRLPPADILVCHGPPAGINDDPGDPAHAGFTALRAWVERQAPRLVLHGHTLPDPRTATRRLGATTVTWVRGARVVVIERAGSRPSSVD